MQASSRHCWPTSKFPGNHLPFLSAGICVLSTNSYRPNDEKVFYAALWRFRVERLETYSPALLDYSRSDYRRSAGPSPLRIRRPAPAVATAATGFSGGSRFTIGSDGRRTPGRSPAWKRRVSFSETAGRSPVARQHRREGFSTRSSMSSGAYERLARSLCPSAGIKDNYGRAPSSSPDPAPATPPVVVVAPAAPTPSASSSLFLPGTGDAFPASSSLAEEVRTASSDVEALCEEAFNRPGPPPPFPVPPRRSSASRPAAAIRELHQTRMRLQQVAAMGVLPPGALGAVMSHLDRLLEATGPSSAGLSPRFSAPTIAPTGYLPVIAEDPPADDEEGTKDGEEGKEKKDEEDEGHQTLQRASEKAARRPHGRFGKGLDKLKRVFRRPSPADGSPGVDDVVSAGAGDPPATAPPTSPSPAVLTSMAPAPPPTPASPAAPTPASPRNWLARFFGLSPPAPASPARKTLYFRVNKHTARTAVAKLLRDWQGFGVHDVVVDRRKGTVRFRVGAANGKSLPFPRLLIYLLSARRYSHANACCDERSPAHPPLRLAALFPRRVVPVRGSSGPVRRRSRRASRRCRRHGVCGCR